MRYAYVGPADNEDPRLVARIWTGGRDGALSDAQLRFVRLYQREDGTDRACLLAYESKH